VPWSGFDLINPFNRWKTSESPGRVLVVAPDGTTTNQVTGLSRRREVSAQVFEEAAVDLGRALARYAEAGGRVGFPRDKRKGRHRKSFRPRNKKDPSGRDGIRLGKHISVGYPFEDRNHPGERRHRAAAADAPSHQAPRPTPRRGRGGAAGRVPCATVTGRADRWYVCLQLEAADYHPGRRISIDHRMRPKVRRDRGLAGFAVVAGSGGVEVYRFAAPRPLARGQRRLRRRARGFARTQRGSRNR
jgi:putative transposase